MSDLTQINIVVDDETRQMVEEMSKEDGFDNRSAFVRRLIRLEHKRREEAKAQVSVSTIPVHVNNSR